VSISVVHRGSNSYLKIKRVFIFYLSKHLRRALNELLPLWSAAWRSGNFVTPLTCPVLTRFHINIPCFKSPSLMRTTFTASLPLPVWSILIILIHQVVVKQISVSSSVRRVLTLSSEPYSGVSSHESTNGKNHNYKEWSSFWIFLINVFYVTKLYFFASVSEWKERRGDCGLPYLLSWRVRGQCIGLTGKENDTWPQTRQLMWSH
jgi:hypothetical protein